MHSPQATIGSVPTNRLRSLSDRELLSSTARIARDEQRMTVQLLHHIGEVDRRKLYLNEGYPSLFDYCARCLRYSSSGAGRRIQAARCMRRFPEVAGLLRSRELTLGTVALIASVLRQDNKDTVLSRVRGKSLRDRVRPVCVPVERRATTVPSGSLGLTPNAGSGSAADPSGPTPEVTPSAGSGSAAEPSHPTLEGTPSAGSAADAPASDDTPAAAAAVERRLHVQFLASEELMQQFTAVRALVAHRCPKGTIAEVLGVVLQDYLERHSPVARQRRREARKQRPAMTTRASAASRHIPARVRDAVFLRDGGRCTFVTKDGRRCNTRHALQVDHIRPFATGGTSAPENLRLLCAAHNRLAAERTFGRDIGKHSRRRE